MTILEIDEKPIRQNIFTIVKLNAVVNDKKMMNQNHFVPFSILTDERVVLSILITLLGMGKGGPHDSGVDKLP